MGEDFSIIVIREVEGEDTSNLIGRTPHGVIGTEEDFIHAVGIKDSSGGFGGDIGQGGRAIYEHVREVVELFGGFLPNRPSAEVSGDDGKVSIDFGDGLEAIGI